MIGIKSHSFKECKPQEYVVRFVFGGACTVAAGLIAKRFGPGAGGLFLAFPAIFPAGASLIESHEKRRKSKAGMNGTRRGRLAAGVDAAGASLGAIGLSVFALVVWSMLPTHGTALVIGMAALIWFAASMALWWSRRTIVHWQGRRTSKARRSECTRSTQLPRSS